MIKYHICHSTLQLCHYCMLWHFFHKQIIILLKFSLLVCLICKNHLNTICSESLILVQNFENLLNNLDMLKGLICWNWLDKWIQNGRIKLGKPITYSDNTRLITSFFMLKTEHVQLKSCTSEPLISELRPPPVLFRLNGCNGVLWQS